MIKKVKRQLAMLGVVLLTTFGMAFAAAPSASAASGTISGSVQCFYGNNAVVGVWVDATSGKDGWASISNNGYGGKNYSYTLSQGSTYKLHVGCSGNAFQLGCNDEDPRGEWQLLRLGVLLHHLDGLLLRNVVGGV